MALHTAQAPPLELHLALETHLQEHLGGREVMTPGRPWDALPLRLLMQL